MDSTLSWTYDYDALDRLNAASKTGITQGWTYDANGNRLTETGSMPSTYTNSGTSNRLSSISGSLARSYGYDNAGNTLSYGTATFTYNNRGRMQTASNAGTTATYTYNVLGQRIRRATSSVTTLYVYDEAGHRTGEYTAAGALVQETVWLGDIPVATLRPNGAGGVNLFYVHTDHLNTPRLVTDTANNIRWRWDSDPFGATPPNENPLALGTFEYNLRFPGQQYDQIVGLHYNYFRDLDPATARYVEPDPVSQLFYFNFSISPLGRAVLPARIRAGFWNNLFAYGAADPVSNSDSTGQDAIWDYLGKTIGKQAASKIQGMGISGVLAAGCIADNCKRKVTNRDWFGAYADCLAVLSKLQKAAGATQIVGDTNGFISSCADACVSAMPSLKTCPECQRNPEQK